MSKQLENPALIIPRQAWICPTIVTSIYPTCTYLVGSDGCFQSIRTHIDLCAIEYSLGDALTALKDGDEACLHICHLTWRLSTASPNLSCELLTDKMILLTKCSSAIWFLTIRTTWEYYDFPWENLFKFIILAK